MTLCSSKQSPAKAYYVHSTSRPMALPLSYSFSILSLSPFSLISTHFSSISPTLISLLWTRTPIVSFHWIIILNPARNDAIPLRALKLFPFWSPKRSHVQSISSARNWPDKETLSTWFNRAGYYSTSTGRYSFLTMTPKSICQPVHSGLRQQCITTPPDPGVIALTLPYPIPGSVNRSVWVAWCLSEDRTSSPNSIRCTVRSGTVILVPASSSSIALWDTPHNNPGQRLHKLKALWPMSKAYPRTLPVRPPCIRRQH